MTKSGLKVIGGKFNPLSFFGNFRPPMGRPYFVEQLSGDEWLSDNL